MKLSLKLRDDTHENPLLRAKIPVSILGLPFLSGIVAGDASDLAFSLRTNFSSGPSISLTYHPAISATAANPTGAAVPSTSSAGYPFSLSLKSGIGLFGSPQDSPLVFTAQFSLHKSNGSDLALTPFFSLQMKPQFGNFSLRKSASSSIPNSIQISGSRPSGESPNGVVQNPESANEFAPGRPLAWKDLQKVENFGDTRGILSGIFVTAKTMMPLTKRSVVNFRWGVNFETGQGSKISRPVLLLNKIGLERIEDVRKVDEKKDEETQVGDIEMLKGMYGWMKREMDELQKQNTEMRQVIESMKTQAPLLRTRLEERDFGGKKPVPSSSARSSNNFEKWRSKKNGVEENGHGESRKPANQTSEMENELQKAIKAAAA